MELSKMKKIAQPAKVKLFWILFIIFAIIIAIGLGATFLTIYYGKPVGDDFSAIHDYGKTMWLQNSIHSFLNTGRYSQSVTASIFYGIFQNSISIFLPIIVFGWFGVLSFLYINKTTKLLSIKLGTLPKILISTTFVFLFIFVNRTVDPNNTWFAYQDFFFSSAIVTYTIALLLLFTIIYIYLFHIKKPLNKISTICLAGLLYVTGLFNEIQPSTIIGLSTVIIILSFLRYRKIFKKIRLPLVVAILSSAASLATMYLSPANIVRRKSTGGMTSTGKFGAIADTIKYTLTNQYFRPSDLILIGSFAVICFVAYRIFIKNSSIKSSIVILTGLLTLLGFILSVCASRALVVIGYGNGAGTLPRTLLIPQLLYVLGFFITIFGCLEFIRVKIFRDSPIYPIIISLACSVLLLRLLPRYIQTTSLQLEAAMVYSRNWTVQDALLREKAKTNSSQIIYLPDIDAGIGDSYSLKCTGIYAKSTHWLNSGLEEYYGVKKVCAESDLN